MFNSNGTNAILKADAECISTSSELFCKVAMNVLPPAVISSQNTPFLNEISGVKSAVKPTDHYQDNVIPITTATKSAQMVKLRNVNDLGEIKFHYPMLECS